VHEGTAGTDAPAVSACYSADLYAYCMVYLDRVPAALTVATRTAGPGLSAVY